MYVRGVRGQVGMAAAVALYKKRKKNYKIRIVRRPGALYLYRWQLVQLNDQNGSVSVICKHRFRRSFRGVYGLTRWFIFIFRSTNRQCFFKSVSKRLNPATINEFTEAQKLISTSKGFSSRLEENFPALILLFPLSKIWKITQNTGKVSFNFKCLSAQWQRRTLSAKCISSLWWYLTLMIVYSFDSRPQS